MLTVLAGLASAVFYATSDMLSQRMARTVGVIRVLGVMLPVSLVIVMPLAVLIAGLPASGAEWRAVAYSAAAGVVYLVCFFAVLAALKVGDLSLVAPLASLATLFVAAFALLGGERPTSLQAAGIVLGVIGGLLASLRGRAKSTAGAGLALMGAFLWALFLALFDRAGEISWLSQAAWSRLAAVVVFVPIAAVVLSRARRERSGTSMQAGTRLSRGVVTTCIVASLLELTGLVAATGAVQLGPLTVAGVTTCQYGTVAVIIGLLFLKERPRIHQLAGVVCTLVAVTLLAGVG